jgi:type IV pilus assembly protein PilQ
MGDVVKGNSMERTKRIGSAAAAAVWAWAAVAAGAAAPVSASTQASISSIPPIAQIATLEVYEAAPGAWVEVGSNGPLIWTTYRDSQGNLVVELPNARPDAALVNRAYPVGLVASIRIATAGTDARPLTRLVIATREDAEHRIETRGDSLRIDLVPTGREAAAELPAAPAPAAPVAPAEPVAVPAAAPAAPAPPPAVPAGLPEAGTADRPLVAPPPSGQAATELTGIVPLGTSAVRIVGNGEFAYSTFRLESPERFVIDLDGVLNRTDRNALAVGEDLVTRVRVSQFRSQPAPVSRVVFDLTVAAVPAIERSAEGLLVRFGGELPVAAEPVAQAAPAEPAAAAPPPPQPAEAPFAPIEIAEAAPPALPEPAAAPDRASAPAATSDVEAFAPAAVAAPAAAPAAPQPTVAAFEAQDVKPSAPPEPGVPRLTPAFVAGQTLVGGRREYTGEPISLSLRDNDIKEVLRAFARITGLNVVVQPGVRGSVTVELEKVPWDQALDQILKINGLGYELEGNIMRVAPLGVLEAEAKRAQALAAAQALSIPLRTVVKRLSYSTAGQIAGLLARGHGLMSQRGTVIVDGRTNTLIIKELPNYIDTVLAIIETLDQPEPQVVIEAKIIETSKNFTRTLGISWGFTGVADQAHGNDTGLEFPYHYRATGGVGLLTGGSNAFINLSMGNILDTLTLNARLQAAETEGLVNILSAPKVVTLNNSRATIQSGVQLPIQTASNNTVSVQFVNATLQLGVTPQVTAEGTVMLDIQIQKREPLFAFQVTGSAGAPISTKDAKTRVIVRDGGTTVIGGIYTVSTDQGQDRVPGLANIPILGHLFKNRRAQNDNEELLIFISPRVIKL